MSEKEASDDVPRWLFILIAPAIGSYMAYLYETGYCEYFGIPNEFVEIGVMGSIKCTVAFVFCLPFIIQAGNVFAMFAPKTARGRAIRQVAILTCLMGLLNWAFFSTLLSGVVVTLLFAVSFSFYYLLLPHLMHRNEEGVGASVQHHEQEMMNVRRFQDFFTGKYGKTGYLLIILLMIFTPLGNAAGRIGAKMRTHFIVAADKPERLIVKKFGGYYVAVDFDRETRVIGSKFTLVELGKELKNFQNEWVGPLRRAPKPKIQSEDHLSSSTLKSVQRVTRDSKNLR